MKEAVRNLLRRFGLDLTRYDVSGDARARRQLLMHHQGVQGVLDVGANQGEYGLIVRAGGFNGTIHSFEPLSGPFALLQQRAVLDGNWWAHPVALGAEDGEIEINVSANSYSSSALPMADALTQLAPEAAYTKTERATLMTLLAAVKHLNIQTAPYLLKIDTQGLELEVLRGAGSALDACVLVELEVSFVELYQGQALYPEIHEWMVTRGYRAVGFDTSYGQVDLRTGETQQLDITYVRANAG